MVKVIRRKSNIDKYFDIDGVIICTSRSSLSSVYLVPMFFK
jgi:hypothetical protein